MPAETQRDAAAGVEIASVCGARASVRVCAALTARPVDE
jgi:hypothetical protein